MLKDPRIRQAPLGFLILHAQDHRTVRVGPFRSFGVF